MRSNPKYDDPELLRSWDRWLQVVDFSSARKSAMKMINLNFWEGENQQTPQTYIPQF